MHLHKWRYNSSYARTCTKCGQHQFYSCGWKKVSCDVYSQMILYGMGKDMQKLEQKECDFCKKVN